jgi:SAM-dependent methyltransferase
MYKKRTKCASCNNSHLTQIHDFGEVPLAGNFPTESELSDVQTYQLSLVMCEECKLVQTNSIISPEVLFSDYRYKSSIGLTTHFNDYTNWFINKFGKSPYSILEIGCNDGVLLHPMQSAGFDIIGVDPAENIIKNPVSDGLSIYGDYFSTKFVESNKFNSKFDFILANNSFAHIDNILDVVNGVEMGLKGGGYFIIEVHYVLELIKQFQYDNIYHEHIYYYSLTSLQNLLSPYGIYIVDFEYINTHSGSIRVVFQKGGITSNKVKDTLLFEEETGLTDIQYYTEFSNNIIKHSTEFINTLQKIKSEGNIIYGYGASGRANMLCNILKLTNDDISVIFDESIERIDRYIPNSNIPITDANKLDDMYNDNIVMVIFAWNYTNMIIDKLKKYNFKFLIPFPSINLVNSDYINEDTL